MKRRSFIKTLSLLGLINRDYKDEESVGVDQCEDSGGFTIPPEYYDQIMRLRDNGFYIKMKIYPDSMRGNEMVVSRIS